MAKKPSKLEIVRRSRELNQLDISIKTGISQTFLSLYENGYKKIPPDHLKLLCKVLKCTPEDILE